MADEYGDNDDYTFGDEDDDTNLIPVEAGDEVEVPPIQYEFLDHPADVQIHSWGENLTTAFEQSAMAMFSYMSRHYDHVEQKYYMDIEAEGHDEESLLYKFLDEFLYRFSTEPFMYPRVVKVLDYDDEKFTVKARGYGEPFDVQRFQQENTYLYVKWNIPGRVVGQKSIECLQSLESLLKAVLVESTDTMADDLMKFMYHLIKQVDGLYGIIISDRDGVPVLKVCDETFPPHAQQPAFLAMFGIATEQASKLGLSKNKSLVAMYMNYQLVLLNKQPLIVTMIASSSANTGLMLDLESKLDDAINELKSAVIS